MSVHSEKEFWLGGTFVSPEFRGRGIGSALAEKVAQVAQNFGAKNLYLQTEFLDGGLYQRLGWDVMETIECDDGVRAAIMVRRLAE